MLKDKIKSASIEKKYPDGEIYKSLSVPKCRQISKDFNVKIQQVEITALENGVIPERYIRNAKSYLPDQQIKLLRSCVAIVGLGGLGGCVAEILARMGIGTLNLIDGDFFEDSNLNRQYFSSEKNIAESKAKAALTRIKEINSAIEASMNQVFISSENAIGILGKPDLIVDCLDNIQTRFVLQDAAKKIGCPLVSAALAGISGHVTLIFPEDKGLERFYGNRLSNLKRGVEASLGCLPQAVSLIASIQCSEAAKVLLGEQTTLRNRLLVVDLSDNTFETLTFQD